MINEWPQEKTGSFTINCFGFGNDHDSELMTWIADQKDGNFYFIEKVEDVGVCFIDCLGQLFSVIAENVTVHIQATPPKHLSDVMLSKAFGGKEMWSISENNVYSTKILQVYTGMKKNYMIELELPPETRQLQDFEKNVSLVKAWCEISSIEGSQDIRLEADL